MVKAVEQIVQMPVEKVVIILVGPIAIMPVEQNVPVPVEELLVHIPVVQAVIIVVELSVIQYVVLLVLLPVEELPVLKSVEHTVQETAERLVRSRPALINVILVLPYVPEIMVLNAGLYA